MSESQKQLIDFDKEIKDYQEKYQREIPTLDYEYLHCLFHPETTDEMIALGRLIVPPGVNIYDYNEGDNFFNKEGPTHPFTLSYEICLWKVENTFCSLKKAFYQFNGRPVNDQFNFSRDKKSVYFFLKTKNEKKDKPILFSLVILDLRTLQLKSEFNLTSYEIQGKSFQAQYILYRK